MIKIYDKADSEMTKIESSKKFLEDAKSNQVIIVVEENKGDDVTAVVMHDGSVQVDGLYPTADIRLEFFGTIYDFLLKFPIIAQYQND